MPLNTIRQFVTGDLSTAATLYSMPSNKIFILQDLLVTFTPAVDQILKIYDDTDGVLDPILWIDFDAAGTTAGSGVQGNNMHYHFENGIPFGKGFRYDCTVASVCTITAMGYLL